MIASAAAIKPLRCGGAGLGAALLLGPRALPSGGGCGAVLVRVRLQVSHHQFDQNFALGYARCLQAFALLTGPLQAAECDTCYAGVYPSEVIVTDCRYCLMHEDTLLPLTPCSSSLGSSSRLVGLPPYAPLGSQKYKPSCRELSRAKFFSSNSLPPFPCQLGVSCVLIMW